jgi:hypothetical protein
MLRILHINVTRHPTSLWIIQQLREAFPFGSAARFLIFDRDSKYGLEVPTAVRSLRMIPVRTGTEKFGLLEVWREKAEKLNKPASNSVTTDLPHWKRSSTRIGECKSPSISDGAAQNCFFWMDLR